VLPFIRDWQRLPALYAVYLITKQLGRLFVRLGYRAKIKGKADEASETKQAAAGMAGIFRLQLQPGNGSPE
jgi:hypothetical protein